MGDSVSNSFCRAGLPGLHQAGGLSPKSPDFNPEEVNPLDFLVLSELELKVYRGQKIIIIEELKTTLVDAANAREMK